jgi:hypothetical protein
VVDLDQRRADNDTFIAVMHDFITVRMRNKVHKIGTNEDISENMQENKNN